ncbi:MAG: poly-gamma-glutamate hydrolase family protein [Pseudonocardiaceae bacterium]
MFDGVVDSHVPHPTFSEGDAEDQSEFIEQLEDNGVQSGLIALAPHGGDIEPHTDQQAERVASRLVAKAVSSWRGKGWKDGAGAFDRWHITSTDINEASFPLLNSVISRGFTYAVAFHGLDEPEILIGGTAPASLKQEIRDAIAGATAGSCIDVRIAEPDEGFGGDDPCNIVNRLSAGGANGIQIEQSRQARSRHWADIADAVADVYDRKL